MNALGIASIVFAASMGGALVGMLLQRLLPKSHLSPESSEVIKLGSGLIVMMAALVLGLLVGAAYSSFDGECEDFDQMALNVVMLDRTLAQYGAEAAPAREKLRLGVTAALNRLWPPEGADAADLADARLEARGDALYSAVAGLDPQNESQRWIRTESLRRIVDLTRDRWELTQPDDGSLPTAFLVVLAFWLVVLFASFGLFAPRNATMIAVLLICALSVAGAVFLIVDLDQPFDGLIQISDLPLRDALAELNH